MEEKFPTPPPPPETTYLFSPKPRPSQGGKAPRPKRKNSTPKQPPKRWLAASPEMQAEAELGQRVQGKDRRTHGRTGRQILWRRHSRVSSFWIELLVCGNNARQQAPGARRRRRKRRIGLSVTFLHKQVGERRCYIGGKGAGCLIWGVDSVGGGRIYSGSSRRLGSISSPSPSPSLFYSIFKVCLNAVRIGTLVSLEL